MQKFSVRLSAVMILLGLLAASAASPASGQQSGDVSAVLTPRQGLVQMRADNVPEYEWQTVTDPRLISETDWVQTDQAGLAEISFFDGNLVEILPNTMIQIAKYSFADSDSPVVTINESVGDVRHKIDRVLDAESKYEVDTPSAVLTVRGTNFFSSVSWQGDSTVNLETGTLGVNGVLPDGTIGPPFTLTANQSLPISVDGVIGTPGPYNPPAYPPPAPLAPATCGNAICDPGETETCVLDCRTSATCGNGICEPEALEGPATCRVDCVPARQPQEAIPESSAACTVSTARPDVIVRAGPGYDRGVRYYLVSNTNIPVVGKYTAADGSVWWEIHPPSYSPGESNRYWVLAADVQSAGGCDQVPDVPPSEVIAPQPVQPVQPVQPPPVPTTAPVQPPPNPEVAPVSISFSADRPAVNPRKQECATLFWSVSGIKEVYYQGRGVTGQGSSVECPMQTTTYTLTVVLLDGSTTTQTVTIGIDYKR
jgi:hypothetical protein